MGTVTAAAGGKVYTSFDGLTIELSQKLKAATQYPYPSLGDEYQMAGTAFDDEHDVLWYLYIKPRNGGGIDVDEARIVGTHDGEVRFDANVEVADEVTASCSGFSGGYPSSLAADGKTIFWTDAGNEAVMAAGPDGTTLAGYPRPLTGYSGFQRCPIALRGLDAHRLSSEPRVPGDPFLEVAVPLNSNPNELGWDRIVVTDQLGRNRGAETPLVDLAPLGASGEVVLIRDVARSRVDPSLLYLTLITNVNGSRSSWIYAVCGAPLPPSWLHSKEVLLGNVEPGETTSIDIRLETAALVTGTYEGVVEVRKGDGIGPVIAEVPVVMEVVEEATETEETQLTAHPNPTSGMATVTLTLSAPGEVRVSVVDVLGREVAVLHEGPLPVGAHRLSIHTRLSSGLYVVRAVGAGLDRSQRLVVVR